MKTQWDYTELADAYLERPEYAHGALEELFQIASLSPGSKVCDIGAGVGHLTLPLAAKGYTVVAVEPNNAMRANGMKRTADNPNVSWIEALGDNTGLPSESFDYVSFGSSFNVLDRSAALKETHRILKPSKWFACLWNHRNLDDPVQMEIEAIIKRHVPDYGYGTRREDQTAIIKESSLFEDVRFVTGTISHKQTVEQVVEAWRSHATLHRQAQAAFPVIIRDIDIYLRSLKKPDISVPYTTRAWTARRSG